MKVVNIILLTTLLICVPCRRIYSQNAKSVDLESQISKILQDYHVPGAAVALVSKDSIVWMTTLGLADVKNRIPVSDSTLFASGSISKTFVATSAMIAQEKGLLNINDPIKKLIPSLNYNNEWSQTSPVKFINLLEHTSGFDEAHFNIFSKANSSSSFSEVMKMSKSSLDTRWEPGKYFEYNTLGYIASAYIIEQNVGVTFEEFIAKNLLQPLEMNSATYHPNYNSTSNFAKGYTGIDFKEVLFPDLVQWPAGFMTITIGDMSDFTLMLLNKGRFKNKQILSPVSVRQMETPETSLSALAGVKYGYAKGLWGKFERGYHFYGHSGRVGGFLSEFGYSRDLDLGYVILTNNVEAGKAIKAIKRELLNFIEIKENERLSHVSKVDIQQLNDLVGCYQPITSVPQIGEIAYFIYRLIDMQVIKEENGKLYQSAILGGEKPLIHVKKLLFKNTGQPIATSSFIEGIDKNWQWQSEEASYRKIPMWWGYFQFYTAIVCLSLMIIGFVILFFCIPIRVIKKKNKNIQLQVLPLLAVSSFLGMIISLVLFYDAEKMYSLGAVLFFVFGWSFFIFSFLAFIKGLLIIYRKVETNPWIKYHSLLTTIACCIVSSYLFYWGIINLMLWSY